MLRLLILAIVFALAPANAQESQGAETQRAESQRAEAGLATFDAVWSTINRKHFDPDFNGVDWKALKKEMRPRAEAAEDLESLRAVIHEMLARLQQSHFALIEKESLNDSDGDSSAKRAGSVGIDFRWREQQAWITFVKQGSPAEQAGVRTGWILDSVGEGKVADIIQEFPVSHSLRAATRIHKALAEKMRGAVGSHSQFTFVTDDSGTNKTLELTRTHGNATAYDMPGLPTFFLTVRTSRIEDQGLTIGVLHFSNWFPAISSQIDQSLFSMRDYDGIIIDLRGNSGGAGAMARTVAGHFFSESTSLGTQVQRRREQEYRVTPRQRHHGEYVGVFEGPLAILSDETTGSCSEVFAGGMQALGRARIFGERSAGAALPATLTKLPNGDYLLHAIADFLTVRGESMEGDGVKPDEVVLLKRADLLRGQDAVRNAAVKWIQLETAKAITPPLVITPH